MEKNYDAILIHESDNVATVTRDIARGENVRYLRGGAAETLVSSGVPKYHKIALHDIAAGQTVYKYGEPIGYAKRDIARGAHVHNHNLGSGAKEDRA